MVNGHKLESQSIMYTMNTFGLNAWFSVPWHGSTLPTKKKIYTYSKNKVNSLIYTTLSERVDYNVY